MPKNAKILQKWPNKGHKYPNSKSHLPRVIENWLTPHFDQKLYFSISVSYNLYLSDAYKFQNRCKKRSRKPKKASMNLFINLRQYIVYGISARLVPQPWDHNHSSSTFFLFLFRIAHREFLCYFLYSYKHCPHID